MIRKKRVQRTLREVIRVPSFLIVGYHRIIEASMGELRSIRRDCSVMAKLYENPLQSVLLSLVDLFEVDSKESQERVKGKVRRPSFDATSLAATLPEVQHSMSSAR